MAEKPNNEQVKDIFNKWLNNYWFPYLVNETYAEQNYAQFGIIKRVIFVIDGYKDGREKSRQGIIIPVPGLEDQRINVSAIKQWEECYLGKCRILKIIDWDGLGNVYVYLKTPN